MVLMKNKINVPVRDGDDGYYGRVFESSYGVVENNKSSVDCPSLELELKTKKRKSNARTTLFCMEPKWGSSSVIPNLATALALFKNSTGRLNTCISTTDRNNLNLQLKLVGSQLWLNYGSHAICYWNLPSLLERAESKLKNLLLCEHDGSIDETNSLVEFSSFDKSGFVDLLARGKLVVEFRLKESGTSSPRNRGTAFRMLSKYITDLYSTSKVFKK